MSAASSPREPTDIFDGELNAKTNARCPGCNNPARDFLPRNYLPFSRGVHVQSTPRYPSVERHYTGSRMEQDRLSGPINTGSPKILHNRTPFSVDDSTSTGSTSGKQSSNHHHKKPLLHGSSLLPQPVCSDPLCTEFLSTEDKNRFNSCVQKVESHKGHPEEGHCRFMPQTHRAPVALASFPGSGNTWLRGLLETATGICTGFEFCDISMRVKGFAGENIVSGAVLVVKTHGLPNWKAKKRRGGGGGGGGKGHFDSAVFLVRNPLDALVSEWNRRVANDFRGYTISFTSHVKSAGKEMFGECVAMSTSVQDLESYYTNATLNFLHLCRDQSQVGGVSTEADTSLAVHDKGVGGVPRASRHPGGQIRRPPQELLSRGEEDTHLPPGAIQRQRGG